MELIDTHVHFWDLRSTELNYPWLQPGTPHPILGDIDSIKSPLYDANALLAETRHCDVRKIVHVEADARSADPDAESRFVRQTAERAGLPVALVVHADLAAPDASARLVALAAQSGVIGIRDFQLGSCLREDPVALTPALLTMADHELVLDLDCAWEEMPQARQMADRYPELAIVLEHVGYPRSRDDDYFSQWAPAIRDLSTAPNVSCKLSGLGMTDRRWTIDSLDRWVKTCLDAFGPDRLMFGSNWPVDRIASSYDAMASAFIELVSACSEAEQRAICFDNADQTYFRPRDLRPDE